MKRNFTFEELSRVFASAAKIESAVARQIEAEKEYDEKERVFDAEFAKYGYTFFNAPKSLQTMFDEKCALMDERDKAQRKAFKAIKDFASLIELGKGVYTDWIEDEVMRYISEKHYYQVERAARFCKSLAVEIANRVR